MLRGPQTSGELKQRTDRLHSFADLASVEAALDRLTERELGRWLERRPGQKEARYTHLMEEDGDGQREPAVSPGPVQASHPAPQPRPGDLTDEVAALRRDLDALRADVAALREQVGDEP